MQMKRERKKRKTKYNRTKLKKNKQKKENLGFQKTLSKNVIKHNT